MRISDWSSDVCSSDLPEVLAISTQQAFADLAAAGVLESALAERLIAATRFLRQVQETLRLTVGHAIDSDTLSATLRELGTASSRERQCQSVYIPGVATYIKKKTHVIPQSLSKM